MTLILVLLYQNLILGLQVNTEAISQSKKSSKTHFPLHFLLLSIQSFDLYLSRSFYSFFLCKWLSSYDFLLLLYLHCIWLAVYGIIFLMLLHSMQLVPCGILFLLLLQCMRVAPCRILLLLFLHYGF